MKIALLLTGFARQYNKSFLSIKKYLLDKYDVDIYISSWDKIEKKYNPHSLRKNPEQQQLKYLSANFIHKIYANNLVKCKLHNYEEYYQNRFSPIKFIDRKNDVFKNNQKAIDLGSFWVERLRDQWYIVQQGWNLIENKQQYDIFFRIRFDIYLLTFRIQDFNLVVTYPEFEDLALSDYLAYGNYESMNKYCNMFDHIENMYIKHNVNIAISESMLEFYLKHYCNINYHIDKGLVYRRLNRL